MTSTVGGTMLGNCSTGSVTSAMHPNSTMATEMTMESTGRSINVFSFIPNIMKN